MSQDRILIIEDEPGIRSVVRAYLERVGYEVWEAETGERGLALARERRPSLVILDLMLPGVPGESVCRILREESGVPVIMLTAKVREDDRVAGLSMGADDYVTKPFSPRELVARVKAVLRRSTGVPAERLVRDDLVIDTERYEVTQAGRPVTLTPSEFRLLAVLAREPGRVFTREELVSRVAGEDFEGFDRTIDAHIKNLRQKLGDSARQPRYIASVYGVGYRFLVSPAGGSHSSAGPGPEGGPSGADDGGK
ncbi:MAG TPA: response regulator transcription factor [Firmicutes bacterium]|nr:response regulator transcription factor [Bacillota bacterium]